MNKNTASGYFVKIKQSQKSEAQLNAYGVK
jgi:hypothetical protein